MESAGEKGVGFKSGFCIAERAWIVPNDYMFKFDASGKMGMLLPFWESPPDDERYANTSMYFDFRSGIDEGTVFNGLHLVGDKVLIFLRKLREIQLQIHFGSGDRVRYKVEREDGRSSEGLTICWEI